MDLKIKLLNSNATMPAYAKDGDAGMDLVAAHNAIIAPGETRMVGTSVAI